MEKGVGTAVIHGVRWMLIYVIYHSILCSVIWISSEEEGQFACPEIVSFKCQLLPGFQKLCNFLNACYIQTIPGRISPEESRAAHHDNKLCHHYCISLPFENRRKPLIFCLFQGV